MTRKTLTPLLRHALIIAFIIIYSISIYAQKVSGIVVDSRTSEPIVGAVISVVGNGQSSPTGAISDIDGKFSIAISQTPTVLEFRYMGYLPQEIDIYDVEDIDDLEIRLREDNNMIEGVVVTAIGKEKQIDKMGSTQSVIAADAIQKAGTASLINALSGKASGVKIASPNGEPGMGSNIIIRGANTFQGNSQPLIILDGAPISNDNSGSTSYAQQSHLNDLNPNDIESLQVLKGASAAALWGSRAANGVIVITTKNGHKAIRPKVVYSFTRSIDWISDHHPLQKTWGQGTGGKWNKNVNTSWGDKISERSGEDNETTGKDYFVGDITGKTYYAISKKNSKNIYVDENFDAVFHRGGFTKHDFSISGGNERGNYYFSYGNQLQDGIVRRAYYDKHNVRFNATYRLADWLKASAKTSFNSTKSNRVASNGDSSNGVYLGLLRTPADFDNTDYIGTYVNEDGVEYTSRQRMYRNEIGKNQNPTYNNPLWAINKQSNVQKNYRFIITPSFELDPVEWLNLTLRTGIDFYSTQNDEYYAINSQGASNSQGSYSSSTSTRREITADAILRLTKQFTANVNLTATVGYSINDRESAGNSGSVSPFDVQTDIQASTLSASSDNKSWSNTLSYYRTNRGFFIADAELLEQIFISVSGMREASSSIGGTYFYPSADAAWQFTKTFRPDWLSFGKVRVAWGKVGTAPAAYHTRTTAVATNANFGGSYAVSSSKGNPDIKPEVKEEWEIGTDLRFLRDRISLTFSYYNSHIEDLIYSVDLNPSSGYSTIYANGGKMENSGLELELSGHIIKKKDLELTANVNWSKNKNKVTELNGTGELKISSTSVALEGYPIGVLYRPGVLRDSEGTPILDANGFPQLSTGNVVLGDPNPDWRGGFGMNFSYKNFDFDFLFEHSHGGKYINRTQLTLYGFGTHKDVEGEITLKNDLKNINGKVFTAGTTVRGKVGNFGGGNVLLDEAWYNGIGGGLGINKVHDYYIQDNTWTKLRNVTVAYNLHSRALADAIKLSNIRFSVTGRDLLVWDNLIGIDPESNNYGVSNAQGMDYFSSPATRSILFGVELTF
ncbi:MAG: SusC/RagA family TonB-linked outer membrane protein [Bacteroidales bacterium]|nr:SusC/RagA family TonB-linked outer membrane protein [Bacteroidales bacterium]